MGSPLRHAVAALTILGCQGLAGVPADRARGARDAAVDVTGDAAVDAGEDVTVNVPVGANLAGVPDRIERHAWPVSVSAMTAAAVAGGRFVVAAGVADGFARDFAVARFGPEFRADPFATAAPDQFVRHPLDYLGARSAAIPRCLAVDPEGRMLLAGTALSNNLRGAAVIRLRADGSLDEGFGDGGRLVFDRAVDAGARTEATWRHALADAAGVLLVGADRIPYNVGTAGHWARLDADGRGATALRSDPRFLALSVVLRDGDGYVLVGELAPSATPALLFLDARGEPRDVGERGMVRHAAQELGGMHPRAARRDARGGIVVVGAASGTFETGYLRAVRFEADGRSDMAFGGGGFVRGPRAVVWNRSETLQAGMIPWGADSFLLAATEGFGASVLRLRDGVFDPSFGDGGTARVASGEFGYVFALLPARDGGLWALFRAAMEREVRAAHFAPR